MMLFVVSIFAGDGYHGSDHIIMVTNSYDSVFGKSYENFLMMFCKGDRKAFAECMRDDMCSYPVTVEVWDSATNTIASKHTLNKFNEWERIGE